MEKDGNEILEVAAAHPTVDEMMRRDPADVTDADIRRMVIVERGKRAQFIKADEDKKAKRRGQPIAAAPSSVDAEDGENSDG